jgi:flagellin
MLSLNTNVSAMAAAQALNTIGRDMAVTQQRISTGRKINGPEDNPAIFSVAQGLRAEMKANEAVQSVLGGVRGLVGVTNAALKSVSEQMGQIRDTLTRLADANLSADQRAQYTAAYGAQRAALLGTIQDATFNGRSLIDGGSSGFGTITALRSTDGGTFSIAATDLVADAHALLTDVADAAAAQTLLDGGFATAQQAVGTAMGAYGAAAQRIDGQVSFLKEIRSSLERGLGAIVDADMAQESAMLSALQVRQQLAAQALSIANSSPQIILSLFR